MVLRHRDINFLFFGYTALNNRMIMKCKVIDVSCFLVLHLSFHGGNSKTRKNL